VIDCNQWKTEKRHECTNMGKVKGLELWWQLYLTSLPQRHVRNITPIDFFRLYNIYIHKSTATIHTANQQQLPKRQLKKLGTKHLRQIRIQYVQKVKTPKQFFTVFCNCFLQLFIHSRFHSTHSLLITTPINVLIKDSSPFPTLHFTSLHSTSLCFVHFTSLYCTSPHTSLNNFSLNFRIFTSLYSASLQFSMITSTLYVLLIQLNYHFPYPHLKVIGLQGRIPVTSAVN